METIPNKLFNCKLQASLDTIFPNKIMKMKLGNGLKPFSLSIIIVLYMLFIEISYTIYLGRDIYWLYGILGKNYYSYIIFLIVIEIVGNLVYKNVRKERNSFRSIVMYLLFFLAFIPGMSFFTFESTDLYYRLLYVVYWINVFIFYAIAIKVKYNTDGLGAATRKDINKLFVIIMIIFAVYLGYEFQCLTKIDINLRNIYDLRQRAKDAGLSQIALIFRSWVSNIVLPFLFLWSLNRKNYLGTLLFLYLNLVMFSVAGEKTILLLILLGGTLSILSKRLDKAIPLLLISLAIISIFEYYIIGGKFVASLFTYRTSYLPVEIGYYFYDYLKDKPKLWFMEGAVGSRINTYLFDRTGLYSPTLAYKIGYEYFGSVKTNANTGLFGSAYAEMGIMGIVIGPLILIVCLIWIDRIYRRYDIKYTIIIAIYFVSYAINGPVTGMFLSILVPSFLLIGRQ